MLILSYRSVNNISRNLLLSFSKDYNNQEGSTFLHFALCLILAYICMKFNEDILSRFFHKRPYKSRFIANSSACTTTELSILLTSCLTAIKNHVIKYCTTVYKRNGKNLFWSIKNSGEILNKLKSRGFLASGLSTYDFSTLYTTLPHNLIKEKLTELIEQTFNREGLLYLACNDKNAFFYFRTT